MRQQQRVQRRVAKGLTARHIGNPSGPRAARADGVPVRAYRRDTLSRHYQHMRAEHAAQSRAASQAKQARAREIAARIVATHGNTVTVEDCTISTWARLWGKRIALFSPGMLVTALAAECAATGGRLYRASTRTTALSQHCLCGARVPKTLASAPITAATAGCTPIATSPRRCWQRASSSPIPMTHAPRGSTTDLPTPCGRGWPSGKSGRAQSTGTSHQHHRMLNRPGPAATPAVASAEQAALEPTPEQTKPESLDVAGPAENNQPPN